MKASFNCKNVLIIETSKTNKRARVELYESLKQLGCKIHFFYKGAGPVVTEVDDTIEIEMPFVVERHNANPLKELKLMIHEIKMLREHKIDTVIIYGIKTIPRVMLAAKFAGVKRTVCIVNGAGNLFMGDDLKKRILRILAFPILSLTFRMADNVYFQNRDDYDEIIRLGLASKKNSIVVNGSGINVEEFSPHPLIEANSFLLITRLTGTKGVNEFVKAAEIVKREYPSAIFNLVGPNDDHINGVNMAALNAAVEKGILHYHGETDDVKKFISAARIFVFPSYYREGIPRSIMEAMAMGRPIITTTSPGCRETVVDGVNGFRVPPRDEASLAERMIWMIQHHEEVEHMGTASRKLCVDRFDVNTINRKMMQGIFKGYSLINEEPLGEA